MMSSAGYLEFGDRAGDSRIPPIGSLSRSAEAMLNLSVPLVYYRMKQTLLYVSTINKGVLARINPLYMTEVD